MSVCVCPYCVAVIKRVSWFRAGGQRRPSLCWPLSLRLIGCYRSSGLRGRGRLTSRRHGRGRTGFRRRRDLARCGSRGDGWRWRSPGGGFDWWRTKGKELHAGRPKERKTRLMNHFMAQNRKRKQRHLSVFDGSRTKMCQIQN